MLPGLALICLLLLLAAQGQVLPGLAEAGSASLLRREESDVTTAGVSHSRFGSGSEAEGSGKSPQRSWFRPLLRSEEPSPQFLEEEDVKAGSGAGTGFGNSSADLEHEVIHTWEDQAAPVDYGSGVFPPEELLRTCGFADWTDWSVCTSSCSGGHRVRTRDALGLRQLTEEQEQGAEQAEAGRTATRWTGRLLVAKAGRYTFGLGRPAVGVSLKVGPRLIMDDRSASGRVTNNSLEARAWLVKGSHPVSFEIAAEPRLEQENQFLKYSGPDTNSQFVPVPSSALRHQATEPHCRGASAQLQGCNVRGCPVDCAWADWGGWSSCTRSCSGGTMRRHREVAIRALYGGRGCHGGRSIEEKACNTQRCDDL